MLGFETTAAEVVLADGETLTDAAAFFDHVGGAVLVGRVQLDVGGGGRVALAVLVDAAQSTAHLIVLNIVIIN